MTADIGWRVSRLRKLRGLSQSEVAQRTGKHTSFISRVERPAARLGVPKRDTIEAILDAIEATPEERAAVFRIETSAPTAEEIEYRAGMVKAQYDESDLMVLLLDGRWVRRYMNPRFRGAIGLTHEEYKRTLGQNVLIDMLDPAAPMYSAYPETERLRAFSMRAAIFKLRFAEHRFDSWYLDLEDQIKRYPSAEAVWHSLPVKPAFTDRQEVTLRHRDGTLLHVVVQLRQMYDAPDFVLLEVAPGDEQTASEIDRLAPPRSGSRRH
jgi:transcriptional regulator with XRE-family HTH domain